MNQSLNFLKKMHNAFGVVFMSLVLMVLLGCQLTDEVQSQGVGEDDLQKITSAGKIRIGVKADAPPFGALDKSGEYWGFEIQFAQAIAADMGLELEFVTVSSAERIPFLLEDKVDIVIASMTITRERDKEVDFTLPFFQDGQGLLCLKSSAIQSYGDLKDMRVGAVEGSTSWHNMQQIQPACTMVSFKNYDEAMKGLLDGKVEALTSDYFLLMGLMNNSSVPEKLEMRGSRFTVEPYGIALRENQSKLRDRLNLALLTLWEKGVWRDIYDVYFGEGTLYESEHQFSMPIIP